MTEGALRVDASLGERLRRAGLTEQALLAWAGTHRLSALPRVVKSLVARPITPAAGALALFVGGASVPRDRLGTLPLEELFAANLVENAIDRFPRPGAPPVTDTPSIRATVAILPLEQTLLVCDRRDARAEVARVCWPDDSSYHLATAIPEGRRDRWIDLATGSAFAPLARPALASEIIGADLNIRAMHYAHAGARLSSCRHMSMIQCDIGEIDLGRAALVTCNAPILGDPDPAMWRTTDRAFFDRMWTSARRCVTQDGEVIVHCVLEGIPGVPGGLEPHEPRPQRPSPAHPLDATHVHTRPVGALEGEVAIVVYTPPGERGYAVTWWRPDAPARLAIGRRELTPARPHVDPRD